MSEKEKITKKKKSLSLSNKIIIGLLLGVFFGLFFGEKLASLSILGDAFIGLLQMTILPYIMLSLMVNIGKLSPDKGLKLIKNGTIVLFSFLLLGLVVVLILPLAFPEWLSASFYDLSILNSRREIDFLHLFIPSNPFSALSENAVPSVVLFSIMIGLGLIRVPGKDRLINGLDVMAKALNNVNKMIIKLTPYGVFAIAASTAGTMTMLEIGKLQTYVLVYSGAVVVLVMVFLPLLISSLTPFKYLDIFKVTKETLITIFATGKIIIVLPQLIESIQKLYDDYGLNNEERNQSVEVLFPLVYPFPNLGTLIIFVFVPFAGWYAGQEIEFSEYGTFVGSLLMSSFVSPITGIPFLLDVMNIPGDVFNLFVVSSVYTDRVRVVLGAMHLITFVILTGALSYGMMEVKKMKIALTLIATTVASLLIFVPLSYYLEYSVKDSYNKDRLIADMELLSYEVEATVIEKASRISPRMQRNQSRIDRIKKRKKIRIGFYEDSMPFAYTNIRGDLVGFDVDMAHILARDLDVSIEFVDISENNLNSIKAIKDDYVDIIMSGIPLTTKYAENHTVTESYMDVDLALVVKKTKENFFTRNQVKKDSTSTIFEVSRNDYSDGFKKVFPQTNVVKLDSVFEFYNGNRPNLDAMLTSAQEGAAWTLLYPEYKVVNPFDEALIYPLVYTISSSDEEFETFLNHWIQLKQKDKSVERLYNYWILGKDVVSTKPRWSIARNVLHLY